MTDHGIFALGDLALRSGEVLPDARLAYRTWGRRENAGRGTVLMPTFYTGTHHRYESFLGEGRALDPERHFIVSINLFGNGLSTSPSTAAPGSAGAWFPRVSFQDNVDAQHRLLTGHLGIERLHLVTGWSMGGCQAFHWAVQHPEMVDAILPFCGSARTSPHNRVFLEGVKAALTADGSWAGGAYDHPPERGLRAFGRVYAGWAYSQAFFREGLHEVLGHPTPEALLEAWEEDHLGWDANDLLAMLATWAAGDVADDPRFGGDLAAALGSIRARCIVMPCAQDLYFHPEDARIEAAMIPRAELRVVESPWGHCAAIPGTCPVFAEALERAWRELLPA